MKGKQIKANGAFSYMCRKATTCVLGKEWKERKFTLCATTSFGKHFSGFFNLDFQLRIWYLNIQGHHPYLFDDVLGENREIVFENSPSAYILIT